MPWAELAKVCVSPHAHPAVRRMAEERLISRLEGLALGERISLARRASRGVLVHLGQAAEGSVLEALLGNPLLVEADVLKIVSGSAAPAEFLGRLAIHHRWGCRRAVRWALALNERVPVAAVLHIVRELPVDLLRRVSLHRDVRTLVALAAVRRLEELEHSRAPGDREAQLADNDQA